MEYKYWKKWDRKFTNNLINCFNTITQTTYEILTDTLNSENITYRFNYDNVFYDLEKGYKTNQFVSATGKTFGGIKFKKTNIQLILKNPLYIGKVRHEGVLYPGLHEPIISEEVFQRVQDILKDNRAGRIGKWEKNSGT